MATLMFCPKCGSIYHRGWDCHWPAQWAHLVASFARSSVRAQEEEAISLTRYFAAKGRGRT